jgi:hypothetical protein
MRATGSLVGRDLRSREEECDLVGGVLVGVGGVDGVPALGLGVQLSHGALGGLGRVGGPDDFAELGDRVFALEGDRDDRPGGHEFDELGVERPLAVHRVELARLLTGEAGHAGGQHAEPRGLEVREDLAGLAGGDRVGLDDGESARHS